MKATINKNTPIYSRCYSVFAERRKKFRCVATKKAEVNPNEKKILDFSVKKEEITQNNVLEMAELIVFMELRFQIGYQGSRMQRMYADLYAPTL